MIEQANNTEKFSRGWKGTPLVPAAGLFLLGVAGGIHVQWGVEGFLVAAGIAWGLWMAAEWGGWKMAAHAGLAVMLLAGGGAMALLNQRYVEPVHVGRFVGESDSVMVALRGRVEVPPENRLTHGNRYWVARAMEIQTDRGWVEAHGEVLVQWGGGGGGEGEIRRGMEVEMYGWLLRPEGGKNPGGMNPRGMLAADRIFAQLRVPRASGVRVLTDSGAGGFGWAEAIARMRLYLRGKLLEHTIQEDVPAALTLSALLLGHRDAAIAEVSQSFADAGVAHLLAISGSHIVFFAGLVWGLVRFLPMRARQREWLIAVVVGMYVLATPCGPPIVRAAVALLMVLAARMLGRPREYLNMLAGAAVVVVLLRPMDIADAGFQLSFVSTAGLILFSGRIHAALFERQLAREALAAELGRGWRARWRYRLMRAGAALLTANLIGAATAAPLVAFHFGQVNLWAVAAGIVALPFVSAAMVVAAIQLLAELVGVGGWLAPAAALCGRGMIWVVGKLAALPGAALAVRPPPVWLVVVIYGLILMWAVRRRWGLSRATVLNTAVAGVMLVVAWYGWNIPEREGRLTVLSAGNGDCMLMRVPGGGEWVIDAGAEEGGAGGASVVNSAVRPALRMAGLRRVDGLLLTGFGVAHGKEAGGAGGIMERFSPQEVWVAAEEWGRRGETLVGMELAESAKSRGMEINTLMNGDMLSLGEGCRLARVGEMPAGHGMALTADFGKGRILLADPAAGAALGKVDSEVLRCDVAVFTGPRRGAGDEAVLKIVRAAGAREVVWCGRGPWAGRQTAAGEWNTADGAVDIWVSSNGVRVGRAVE